MVEVATPITQWVDEVHKDEAIAHRVTHAILTLGTYVRLVVRPQERRKKQELEKVKRKQNARWKICAYLVQTYKNSVQQRTLEERADARKGLVCANTRNVGRLTPKGGVAYDENKRHTRRIKDDEYYRTHRWPRRDKCGPALAGLLHHLWGIT